MKPRRLFLTATLLVFSGPAFADSSSGEQAERHWHVGANIGAIVPRGTLDPGFFVGGEGTIALGASGMWRARLDVDWVHTGGDNADLLSPPMFPRSAGSLDQRLNAVTLGGGADIRVASSGKIAVRLGLSAGAQFGRVSYTAYGMSHDYGGVGPEVTADATATGALGQFSWRALVGWRESVIDIGQPGDAGRLITSGAIVAVGAVW